MTEKNLIIIGSGPGGYVAAARAGQLGLNVTLIEKENKLGGTCLHWGCIPTKALLHQAHLYKEILEAGANGIVTSPPSIDMNNLMNYKQNVIDNMEKGIQALLKKYNVEIIQATARLTKDGKVECTYPDSKKDIISADHIMLATGSEARGIPGIEFTDKIISNKEILTVDKFPESIVVIGAGAVGVEFATVLHSIGKDVTILEMLPNIVPLEDGDVSRELSRAFKKKKLKAITEARVTSIKESGGGVIVTYERKEKENTIEAEKVLVAIGRKPNTHNIGLEDAGIETERGFIKINDTYQTSVKNIWAIGDIVPTPQLAHAASAEGIYVVESIAGMKPKKITTDWIPAATYCEPQIASVGLTEEQAVSRGFDVKTGISRFNTMAKAHILGATEGFVKIVADSKTDLLLGMHIIGPDATEMIGEGVTALNIGATISELRHSIHPHPTLSEVVYEAIEAVEGMAIHGG
ncbi:MAG: dihydrolipoyl dehydrogenase [Acidobacteria bacterium]|nr:dihydrolipoyl dehydrogenase [Acidobacteriota bacterium]